MAKVAKFCQMWPQWTSVCSVTVDAISKCNDELDRNGSCKKRNGAKILQLGGIAVSRNRRGLLPEDQKIILSVFLYISRKRNFDAKFPDLFLFIQFSSHKVFKVLKVEKTIREIFSLKSNFFEPLQILRRRHSCNVFLMLSRSQEACRKRKQRHLED